MDVSIVVTVLNEEGAVDELYRRIAASLDGREWEAIFVDDGSTDGTFAALRALHEQRPARARRALQAQLRPAPGDARGARARARRRAS